MCKNRFVVLAITCSVAFSWSRLQGAPASGLYEIISGTYSECCGIAGPLRSSLPNANQGYVSLTVDSQGSLASMTFLGKDMQTVFSILPCPPGDPIKFTFNYGFIFSNTIIFHVDPGPPPYSENWTFTVSNSVDALRIDGTVGINAPSCADVPTRFSYSNVVAVLMPVPAIQCSEVEICWNAASNRIYQVQYQSALNTNAWTNLGSPVAGNGSTNCVPDKLMPGQPQRFYRVVPIQ